MRLRGRIAARTACLLIPALIALGVHQVRREWAASERAVAARVLARLAVDRTRCEASPTTYAQEAGSARLHVYDREGRAARPDAPPLDPDLASKAAPDGTRAAVTWNGDHGVAVVRLPWGDGPCAIVQLTFARSWTRGPHRVVGVVVLRVTVVAALVCAIVAFAVGPVVTSLRAMTRAVAVRTGSKGALTPRARGGDELAALGRALDDAHAAVDRELTARRDREAALEDHLRSTAHDLAIPLSVLQGHLSALRVGDPVDHDARSATIIEAIAEAHFIGAVISDLGVAARARAGLLDQPGQAHDLRDLVERVVQRHRVLAQARGVALELGMPEVALTVRVDGTAAQQAIGNVVLNAVQYAPVGGWVAVTVDRRDDRFEVRVVDDGPGLAPGEQFDALLREGARGDAGRRRGDGSGAGLAITQRVATAYGWRLAAATPPDGGIAVTIDGPLAPADASER